jgi:hypothetical protein
VLAVSGPSATGKRWGVQADGTAESGGNVGTDFRVNRYNDSGVFVESSLFIKRSTGQVGLGGLTSPAAKLDVTAAGSYHTVQSTQTATGSVSFATYAGTVGLVANRLFDGRVAGDASGRFVFYGDGKHEWGDGGAGGRDTNLYRAASGLLQTDTALKVNTTLNVGAGATGNSAGAAFTTSVDGTTSIGTVVINPFSSGKRALDIRLAADATSRLRVDASSGSGSGTLTFGDGTTADTNLYRASANTLATDDALTVALALRHLGTTLGFYGATAATKPTVTGSRGGNAALASLLTSLATLGLLTDSTTA